MYTHSLKGMKKMKHNRILTSLILTVLLAGLGLTACAAGPKVEAVEGADREAVLAYSEAMTDNLLAGMNAGDYAAFSRDFNADMKTAMPESSLAGLKTSVTDKIGAYVSREVDRVEKVGEYYRVIYKGKFEQDDAVQMLVTFTMSEPHQVAGLFFTSDKLK
jgi:hypothetical protein